MTQKIDQESTPPWDAARVNLTSREMAPGVFAVMPDDVLARDHVATTAGFVIGERGVLVVESMLNGDPASQLIGLVRQATTKPIRFLVNTSYHRDHAYGNYFYCLESLDRAQDFLHQILPEDIIPWKEALRWSPDPSTERNNCSPAVRSRPPPSAG